MLVERTKRAVASTLPKNLIARTPVQVSLCGRRFRRPAVPLYVLTKGGTGMAVCNASETVRTYCYQKQPHLLRICTHAEGGERTVTVAIRAIVAASQKLMPSVTSGTS